MKFQETGQTKSDAESNVTGKTEANTEKSDGNKETGQTKVTVNQKRRGIKRRKGATVADRRRAVNAHSSTADAA